MKYIMVVITSLISVTYAFPFNNCDDSILFHPQGTPVYNRSLNNRFEAQRSPGDSIGFTWKDLHEFNHGKRIMVDDSGRAHIAWMYMDATWTIRQVHWTVRDPDGSYHAPVVASDGYSGFVQVDVMPQDQRTVIAYHTRDPNNNTLYYSYIDIDSAYHAGIWPNEPKMIPDQNHIWPYIAVANNGNIVVATGDNNNINEDNLYVTTDQGDNWTLLFTFDTCVHPSQFVTASPHSNKVAFVNTRYNQGDYTPWGDNDIWYMVSSDGGVSWGPYTNLTDYQDDIRAYAGVDAVWDLNDNLHIVWEGFSFDTLHYGSKIFHWDQFNDTITVVNSPSIYYQGTDGWWKDSMPNQPNCYGLPADRPQVVIDRSDKRYIYCLWHDNDDYNDVSYLGCFNGELYGSYSSDMGVTWAPYVNLTNTRSPGAGSGYCLSEDHMTASPYTFHDSIFVSYMVDRDAGHWSCWGERTCNPIYCWVFNKNKITTGIKETYTERVIPDYPGPTIISGPMVLPRNGKYQVFDVLGRKVDHQNIVPGIYFLEIEGSVRQKIVKVR